MSSFGKWLTFAAVIFGGGMLVRHLAWGQATAPDSRVDSKDRARVVLSRELPPLEGKHLKAILVEVDYGPGEASPPHSHPCAVIGYVAEGTLRTQVKGEREMTYKTGDSFYEAPNGVHLISANASSTEPAKLFAYLLCDHETPLSVEVPGKIHAKENAK